MPIFYILFITKMLLKFCNSFMAMQIKLIVVVIVVVVAVVRQ